MNNKNLTNIMIAAVAVIIGFVGGSLWTENQMLKTGGTGGGTVANAPAAAAPGEPSADALSNVPEVTDADHVRGSENAKITLIEYSDFECPFCNKFHPTMTQVMEEYGDQVAWVYRHYPLAFHPFAQKSAEASECVAKYGGNDAFWKFSDSLFEDVATGEASDVLNNDALIAAATAAGANGDQVKTCLENDEMVEVVATQYAGGQAAGIQGTPGTILVTDDGQYDIISGALPFAQVKTILDGYL